MQGTELNVRPDFPSVFVSGVPQRSRRPNPEAREWAGRFEMLAVVHRPKFQP